MPYYCFLFQVKDLLSNLICPQCWAKIEDFHQFYCEIESVHQQAAQFSVIPLKLVEDKCEDHSGQADCRKEEISERIDSTNVVPVEVKVEGISLEKKKNPPKKRRKKERTGSRPRKIKFADRIAECDQLIAKYINAICDHCSAHFPTFTELQTHSLALHQRRSYVFCCDKRYNQRTRLYEHVLLHVNPEYYQCDICKRNCLDNESLRRHKLKIHTPEEQRDFKCEKCAKAFATQGDLILHKNYHTAMENKEYQCDQCEKW